MMIGSWKCVERYPGETFAHREASYGDVSVIADADGIELDESYSGYSGASGRYWLPANVVMWLVAVVR